MYISITLLFDFNDIFKEFPGEAFNLASSAYVEGGSGCSTGRVGGACCLHAVAKLTKLLWFVLSRERWNCIMFPDGDLAINQMVVL